MTDSPRVLYLSGGVGGARLLHGLYQRLPAEALTAVVNTGDDFRHWGLWICPDLDTVLYTLSGLGDEARGWGRAAETFQAKAEMERLGAPTWFALGDRDLATHLVRSEALHAGRRLTEITAELCEARGVRCRVLPMADAPRATLIDTDAGQLPFQQWFVQQRARPTVRGVSFAGETRPSVEVLHAIEHADLVLLGPSNPYVSIDPILTLRGVREALESKCVVAVSPIVAGRAVKGPLAEMIQSLAERTPSPAAIADHYAGLLRGLVVERGDESDVRGLPTLATDTVMGGAADRARLADEVLAFARTRM